MIILCVILDKITKQNTTYMERFLSENDHFLGFPILFLEIKPNMTSITFLKLYYHQATRQQHKGSLQKKKNSSKEKNSKKSDIVTKGT